MASIATLEPPSRRTRVAAFLPHQQQVLQRGGGAAAAASAASAEAALLGLLAEQRPRAVASLLAADASFLRDTLTASPHTVSAWFGGFSMAGIHAFRHGARALANYALTHRADVWGLLAWRGKHSQAPVAVAAKPHYFGELDVTASVRALADGCPGFWRSEQLAAACEAGEWLRLEPELVAQVCAALWWLLACYRSALRWHAAAHACAAQWVRWH